MIVVKPPYETGIICDHYKIADLTVTLDRTALPDKNISPNLHPSGRVYNASDSQAKTRTYDDIVANSVEPVDSLPRTFNWRPQSEPGTGGWVFARWAQLLRFAAHRCIERC
jgi:hypothetical protein